jgi:hypothetical protein
MFYRTGLIMTIKQHYASENEFRIRVNGTAVRYYSVMSSQIINDFVEICAENHSEYVDVVSIRTEILISQHTYGLMEKHFNAQNK